MKFGFKKMVTYTITYQLKSKRMGIYDYTPPNEEAERNLKQVQGFYYSMKIFNGVTRYAQYTGDTPLRNVLSWCNRLQHSQAA